MIRIVKDVDDDAFFSVARDRAATPSVPARHGGNLVATVLSAFFIVLPFHAFASGEIEQDVSPHIDISNLVERYFQAENVRERSDLAADIEKTCDGNVALVADAVATLQVWPALSVGEHRFSFAGANGSRIDFSCLLPEGYDSTRRHPVVVVFPDTSKGMRRSLSTARILLRRHLDTHVLVVPDRPVVEGFHQPDPNADDLRRLAGEVRRRIHTDTDRAFLLGIGRGADAGWIGAITMPDLFAAAILIDGYPKVPHAGQLLPLILDNLRSLPVLVAWQAGGENQNARSYHVTTSNRAVVAYAKRMKLPIRGVSLGGDEPGQLLETEITRMLRLTRAPGTREVSHWFRYHPHGRAGWLVQTKFKGPQWVEEQSSIVPPVSGDADDFLTGVVKGWLAHMSGRIIGQEITIETRGCAGVELLLPWTALDFEKPITIRCNGRRRWDRPIKPGVATLLEYAYQDWEFQRPIVVRKTIRIRTDAE